MKEVAISPSLPFYFVSILLFVSLVGAQPEIFTNGTTDPSEVRILNSIFQKWGISSSDSKTNQWNISGGEPCSGAAIDSTTIDLPSFNPAIKCLCSYDNATTCRITHLKVRELDVVGVIPDELWNLTFLTNLNLGRNYLSGSLSASIGNLIRMQYLSVGVNALSGELPKELGKLTNLLTLAFGTNNFIGSLPSEIGMLKKLQLIFFDSSGVTGEIPSTFANLHELRTMWASDNKLTGRIPNFIGNWSKLEDLRFVGNSFEGPVPTTFSKLTSLKNLIISELSNGSTSLDFIKDMKSLNILILRNNNISGSIPSFIGEYKSLSQLDLSFNNLTGQIPNSLFVLSSLSRLFLGNNKLTGILPKEKGATLLNIDLSYNELSGTFPSWINQSNLQLNLVANNFRITSSNSSFLPSGLNCLQKGFPCYRGSPNYYNYSIKCGGSQFIDSSWIIYDSDNETLGPATYYVNTETRWAVSNVGLPTGRDNPQYTINALSPIANTLDRELFQSARISSGSLRYYGLGLENGDYNVKLQFAEIFIQNPITWKSLGRRIFDIFIQGKLVLKDFDIRNETGGESFSALSKTYKVQVSENYMEIHLFWAGKGTCCVPGPGIYGPTISAISATPDFLPTVSNKPPTTASKKRTMAGLIWGITVSVTVVSILSVFVVCYFVKRRRRSRDTYQDEEFLRMDARPYTFSYAELRVATNDFNLTNKLGEGGFGPVYKGTLIDGRVVAVKKLSVASRQGNSQFVAEIATVSAVQHRNLVKLYGCCIEGDKRLLVYEYLENKSLDQALFGKRSLYLDWSTRYDISLGVARGLTYLHEESRVRIVHRDVKASNILLDSELVPKISDFGLAKLYDDNKTHISTRVAGTIGYLAPEYAMRGHLTEKADVYAFGVLALEIISGRLNSDPSLEEEKVYLLEWAWQLYESNLAIELVDSSLSDFDENEVKRLIHIALLCIQTLPTLRPSMSRVVGMLSGNVEVSALTTRPDYLKGLTFEDVTSFTSTQASTTKTDHTTSSSKSTRSMKGDYDSSYMLGSNVIEEGI